MNTLKELWLYSPVETTCIIAICAICGLVLTLIFAALLWDGGEDALL